MLASRLAATFLLALLSGSSVAQDPPPEDSPLARASLLLEVVDEAGKGLPQVNLFLEPTDAELEESWGRVPSGTQVRTDAAGLGTLSLPAGQHRTVKVGGYFSNHRGKSLEVEPLKPGEERALRVELQTKADLEIARRAVWADTGEPVIGADVVMINGPVDVEAIGLKTTIGSERGSVPFGSAAARTDEEGWFRVPVRSWNYATVFVSGEGVSLHGMEICGEDGETPEAELILHRSGSLRGTVTGSEASGLTVVAQFLGYTVPVDGVAPGSWSRALRGDLEYLAKVDGQGRYLLQDLPSEVPFLIQVRQGSKVLLEAENKRTVPAGATVELPLSLGLPASIRGTLVDESGVPLANVRMGVEVSEGRRKLLSSFRDCLREGTTDESGRFEFLDLQPGSYEVGTAFLIDEDQMAPTVAAQLMGEDMEVEVTVFAGRFVEGRVLSVEGEPVELSVYGTSLAAWTYERASSQPDGFFRLGPFPPGKVELWTTGGEYWELDPLQAPWDRVEMEAGAKTVELRLQSGGLVRGSAIDAATREPVAASFQYSIPQAWGAVWSESKVGFEYAGLVPGRYSIVAMAADGRIGGRVFDVQAGSALIDQELQLEPGGTIELSNRSGCDSLRVECLRDDFVYDFSTLNEGSSRSFRAPAGEVQVRLYSASENDGDSPIFQEARTVQVTAGQATRVEVAELGREKD